MSFPPPVKHSVPLANLRRNALPRFVMAEPMLCGVRIWRRARRISYGRLCAGCAHRALVAQKSADFVQYGVFIA